MSAQRWKCICSYDGTDFAGWQSQARKDSVQDVIEARLERIFRQPIRIHGSGRTDSGVHATGQVFHFDADWRHRPEQLLAAFRTGLPRTIWVKSARVVSPKFHARFDATGKRYVYHLHMGEAEPFDRPYCWMRPRPLDRSAMVGAAEILQGHHDFRALCAVNGPEPEDTVRDLRRLEVAGRGARIRIIAEADGFLYKMVRSIVGVLVEVGEHRMRIGDVRKLLKGRVRTAAVPTAPPQGLFLEKVYYGRMPGMTKSE